MIDDQPTPLTLTVSKAEPRRERHWLALAYIGKGVIAGVDCNVSVDPDTVLPQLDLQVGAGRPGHEVFPNRGRAIAQRRGYGAPKHGLGVVERKDSVQVLAVHRVGPRLCRCRHLLLRPGRHKCRYAKHEEHRESTKHRLHGTSPSVTDFASGFAYLLAWRSEEHTSELQSLAYLVCRLLL